MQEEGRTIMSSSIEAAIGDETTPDRLWDVLRNTVGIDPAQAVPGTRRSGELWRDAIDAAYLSTRVIYPENGLSHFRMLHDNLRISAMHTRLLLGMLPRAPRLLWRHVRGEKPCPA
jgi:hypothetical protein